MPRLSSILVFAGAAGLLAGLVVLWRAIDTGPAAPSMVEHARPHAPARPVAVAEHVPVATRARPAPPPAIVRALGALAHPPAARPAGPAAPSLPPADARRGWTDHHLEYGGTQLRAQTAAVEPLVRDCLARAAASGEVVTGQAVVLFVVADHHGKFVIESTDSDSDQTTLTDAQLVTCLRETARGMKFMGLPRDAEGLIVTRKIVVDHGKLTQNKQTTFSYLR